MRIFRASTSQALIATLTGDTVATSYNNTLKFDLPEVRYKSLPISINGPGALKVAFDGEPIYNIASSYALRTTLVNTRATY